MIELYATYDNKLEAFTTPIPFKSQLDCKEHFVNYLASAEAKSISLAEYELFYLGKYDRQTGKFDLLPEPKHMYNMRALNESIQKIRDEFKKPEEDTEPNLEAVGKEQDNG